MDTESPTPRLRLALPNKGRLCQPALNLLRETGLVFEEDDRRLFAPCHNYPLDLLFVRADDIGEYTQDGVVDLGITGSNLLQEAGAAVIHRLELGFGRCRLQLAAPHSAQITRAEDLAGHVVATSHPRITAEFFAARQVTVRLIEISGAVEVAPLLGVADAIADLVASGSTLATNGLKPLETLLESQAELVANQNLAPDRLRLAEELTLMIASVIAASQRRYLMLNAPTESVERIRSVIPGMGAPSVIQLAAPGMVAIHAVVDAEAIWQHLGALREAGASSILVLPIEKLIP
ncbi:MAG: ATP phosphoribosyltransferase [Candidatus Dormibacteria bacterium]